MKKIYNVVIIGAGNIASEYDDASSTQILTHAHAVKQLSKFNLLGFYDVDKKKAKAAAVKWKTKVIYNLNSIQKNIDIVCCAVPDEFHYSVLKEISTFSVLKAVICEKPIAKKVIQAKELVDLYSKKDIPLFVNYTRRFMPEFMELKKWVEQSGRLIVGNCFYGKGVCHNCSHMLNILELFWKDIKVLSVDNFLYDYFEDDPSVTFVLEAGSGKIYFYPIDCKIATVFEFDLFFEGGRVKYSDAEGIIEYYKIQESAVYTNELNYTLEKRIKLERTEAMLNLYKNVYNVLNLKKEVISTGMDAYRTICLCESISDKISGEQK